MQEDVLEEAQQRSRYEYCQDVASPGRDIVLVLRTLERHKRAVANRREGAPARVVDSIKGTQGDDAGPPRRCVARSGRYIASNLSARGGAGASGCRVGVQRGGIFWMAGARNRWSQWQ